MTFSDFNIHTNQLFIDLKLLKVRNIIDLQHLYLVYDFYDNRFPTDLKKLFTFSSVIHTQRFHKYPQYQDGNKSIKFHCAELWNEKFKNGISIDEDVSHDVSINQIHKEY